MSDAALVDQQALNDEQARLDVLYSRLDEIRERTRQRLLEVRGRAVSGTTPQARSERDAFAAMHEDRLAQLDAVEGALCFGRLDGSDGSCLYIGRLGLTDDEHNVLLVDWRAPAAEPFYRATGAQPMGVTRRRHLQTRGRKVVSISDDLLDLTALPAAARSTLQGEAALLAALAAPRGERMSDIVATIQADQDRIIRHPIDGALVVDGGPGTGKTAVALHRAAYLLYSNRDRLARSGVLVVGPSQVFLRWIEQVLPSLGENGVALSTLDALGADIQPTADEDPEVAQIKGDARMAAALACAIRAQQRLPEAPLEFELDQHAVSVDIAAVAVARARARRSPHRHNRARYNFARGLLSAAMAGLAQLDPELSRDPWIARELMRSDRFREVVNRLWPRLTAADLLGRFLADPAILRSAIPWLDERRLRLLQRDAATAWTTADVALLDEARSLLGDPEEVLQLAAARRREAAEREFARQVIDATGLRGQIGAGTLVGRFANRDRSSVAERSAADPDWRFGHVIVDEAQELSAMQWRMVLRRTGNLSMTVVGDPAQATSPGAVADWATTFEPVAGARWAVQTLTVNYRTPAEVMDVAARVLAVSDPTRQPPRSVRFAGSKPSAALASEEGGLARLALEICEVLATRTTGRVACLAPAAALPALLQAGQRQPANQRASILAYHQAKGLEFDAVVLLEPTTLLAVGARGWRTLYVALTRTTRELVMVHSQGLPQALLPLARWG